MFLFTNVGQIMNLKHNYPTEKSEEEEDEW